MAQAPPFVRAMRLQNRALLIWLLCQVHEGVFGGLAMENESVDWRL